MMNPDYSQLPLVEASKLESFLPDAGHDGLCSPNRDGGWRNSPLLNVLIVESAASERKGPWSNCPEISKDDNAPE